MKVGIIIPDRCDRTEFTANCLKLLEKQTAIKSNHIDILFVNHAPKSEKKDITERYRLGYEHFSGKEYDCILFMENDDWYSHRYIETMLSEWQKADKPDIFGCEYTIYYHLGLRKWTRINHPSRASAMNTLIKPDLNISWCADDYPYTDLHLWRFNNLNGKTFSPKEPICLGMKHGIGLCGGILHSDRYHRYDNNDARFDYLRSVGVRRNEIEFYAKFKPII